MDNTELKARLYANHLVLTYVLAALAAEDRLLIDGLSELLNGVMGGMSRAAEGGATQLDAEQADRLRRVEAFGVDELDKLFGRAKLIEAEFRRLRRDSSQ